MRARSARGRPRHRSERSVEGSKEKTSSSRVAPSRASRRLWNSAGSMSGPCSVRTGTGGPMPSIAAVIVSPSSGARAFIGELPQDPNELDKSDPDVYPRERGAR